MKLYRGNSAIKVTISLYSGKSGSVVIPGGNYIFDNNGLIRKFAIPDGRGNYFYYILASKNESIRSVLKAVDGFVADIGASHLLEEADLDELLAHIVSIPVSNLLHAGLEATIDSLVPEDLHYVEYYSEDEVISGPIYVDI